MPGGGILLNPSASGSGDCCCGGTLPPTPCVVHVIGCTGSGQHGATVQVKTSTGTVLDSGTTDSSGNFSTTLGCGANRTVVTSMTGYNTSTLTGQTLASTTPLNVTLGLNSSAYCCNPCTCTTPMPQTLHFSDGNGTCTGGSGDCQHGGCGLSVPVGTQTAFSFGGSCILISGSTTTYQYTLTCAGGMWQVDRTWPEFKDSLGNWYYTDSSSLGVCATATGRSTATFSLSDCGSFAWSGGLTKVAGNLPDPVGGTVAISA